MKTIRHITELKQFVRAAKADRKTIGFVPTMGFLHEGHLSLVKASTEQADVTIMSIFVNPLQFGPNEDFDRYPRDLERDAALAEQAGVTVLFTPSVEELYPEDPLPVQMIAAKRTDRLCGAKRPGHFDGVVAVVSLLFHLTEPDLAFFGKKDAQQVAVIDGMVKAYHFPVKLIAVDTVRENDGLAKSSRNVYLSEEERLLAPALYNTLKYVRNELTGTNHQEVLTQAEQRLAAIPAGHTDYLELLSYPKLEPLTNKDETAIIAVAYQFEKARLIDNIVFSVKGDSSCSEQ